HHSLVSHTPDAFAILYVLSHFKYSRNHRDRPSFPTRRSSDLNARDQPAHIELTADDLNNLIAENRRARGKAFVAIEGNRLHIQTDRKSTRLNSSHGSISYAVFCLKKKKKQNTNNIIKKSNTVQ